MPLFALFLSPFITVEIGDRSVYHVQSMGLGLMYTAVFTCTVNRTGGVVHRSIYLYRVGLGGDTYRNVYHVQSMGLGMMYTAVFTCTVNETGGDVLSSVYLYNQWDWG